MSETLPPGFVLDSRTQTAPSALPPGFVLDSGPQPAPLEPPSGRTGRPAMPEALKAIPGAETINDVLELPSQAFNAVIGSPGEERQRAFDAGVEFRGGAPVAQRALSSFAVDEREKLKALKAGLSEYFIRRGDLDKGQQVDTRVGPETGDLEFFDPSINRYRLVNPPGFDLGDLGGVSGDALVMVPEMAATLGVSVLTANPVAGVTAGAAGAYAGEYARLKLGQAMGINEGLSDADIMKEAAKSAGISLAGGAAGAALVRINKAVGNWLGGNPFGRDAMVFSPSETEDAAEAAMKLNGKLIDNKLRFTTGQASDNPDILAVEEAFRKSTRLGAVQKFRAFTREQNLALREYWRLISEPFDSAYQGPFAAGRRVVEPVAARQEAARAGANARVSEAEGAAERALNALPTRPGEEAGAPIRNALTEARTEFTNWVNTRARAVDAVFGDAPIIQNVNTRQAAEKLGQEVKDTLLGSTPLKSAKKNLIGPRTEPDETGDAVRLLRETITGEPQRTERLRKIFDPNAKFTFQEYWETARDLDALIRVSSKGLSAETPRVGTLKFLRSALEHDAIKAFAGTPQAEVFDSFRAAVRAGKNRFDRSVIGDLLSTREGVVITPDSEVFGKLINASEEDLAGVMPILRSNDPQATQALKEATLDFYKRLVAPEGRVNTTAHRKFFDRYGRKLALIFPEEDIKTLSRVGELQKVVDATMKRREEVFKALDKTFSGRLESMEPQELFRKIWMPSSRAGPDPSEISALMKSLKRDPDALKAFQGEVIRDMDSRITAFQQGQSTDFRPLSYKKLDAYLFGTGTEGTGGHFAALRQLFGEDYAKNIMTLHDALMMAQRTAVAPNTSNTAPAANALQHLARVWTGMFTARGRMLTAANKLAQKQANRVMLDALMDPDRMAQLAEMAKLAPGSKRAAIILGQLGGTMLAGAVDNTESYVRNALGFGESN